MPGFHSLSLIVLISYRGSIPLSKARNPCCSAV
uniref:Uncharacterized protein n=1 Tax=Anguilla anguilla TaxID=7936 RepID=A0A0E9VN13_ANGAN